MGVVNLSRYLVDRFRDGVPRRWGALGAKPVPEQRFTRFEDLTDAQVTEIRMQQQPAADDPWNRPQLFDPPGGVPGEAGFWVEGTTVVPLQRGESGKWKPADLGKPGGIGPDGVPIR